MNLSELFKYSKILNVHKLSIFNAAVFMDKIHGKFAPSIFFSEKRKTFSFVFNTIFTSNLCKICSQT